MAVETVKKEAVPLQGYVVKRRKMFMAIPIMATPTLEGEDALRFYRELDENEEKRVPAKEVRRGADLFDAIMRKNPKIGVSSGYA